MTHRLKTLKYAAMRTLPVLCGYLFLGIAFGLLLQEDGYDFRWALLISASVYAGSMQFVMLGFLGSGISLLSVALMTLSVNCRHIFYGLSMLSTYKGMGRAFPYMVFSLTDETYSLLISPEPIPSELDEKRARLYISVLDQFYWVLGSVLGAALGQIIPFDMTGIDFAMTALFVVIFVDQWKGAKSHLPALTGGVCAVVSLLLFGTDAFLLPALCATCVLLLAERTAISRKEEIAHDA